MITDWIPVRLHRRVCMPIRNLTNGKFQIEGKLEEYEDRLTACKELQRIKKICRYSRAVRKFRGKPVFDPRRVG